MPKNPRLPTGARAYAACSCSSSAAHSALPLLFCAVIWAMLLYGDIRHEKTHLEAVFGESYQAYKSRAALD